MFPPRGIPGFVIRLVVCFGILAWVPWPGLRDAYFAYCRTTADLLFSTSPEAEHIILFPSKKYFVFFPPDTLADKTTDIDVIIAHPRGRPALRPNIDVWSGGYLPLAEVIALVLATPIPWRRRWKALVWGAIGANAFLAWRIIMVLVFAVTIPQLGVFPDLAPMWRKTIQVVHDVTMALQTSWVVPIFIWIIVTIRSRDVVAAWGFFSGQVIDAPASPDKAKAATSSGSRAASSLTAQDASVKETPSLAPPTSKKKQRRMRRRS